MSLADQLWFPTSVQVTVLQARGLKIKGKGGTNDAFAVMQVGKEKYQTTVAEKSVAPVWKEEATFDLPQLQQQPGGRGGSERSTLHVQVLHRALVGPDKLLGQAVINLPQLSQDKTRSKTEWFKLLDKTGKADKDRGEVLVDIQFLRNNMTASMFDLSAAGRSKSRLGKFKDKVRGKKKDSEASSTAAASFPQVLMDSEDEEGNGDGEGAAGKDKKKRKKIKSLFSSKTNLQRNMSQSMSVLPATTSLSGSQSSGLNVDPSEGKKKFQFMIHKRSGSSGAKDSASAPQKAAEQSNLCINGSHVYCDEPQSRTSRIGSNFSLASSGHGSMEDVPEISPPSVDSVRTSRQYSPWTEEEISESLKEGEEEEEETQIEEENEVHAEGGEEEDARKKEEEEVRQEEEKRRREEKQRWLVEKARKEEEMIRMEEERRIEEKIRLEEKERREEEEKARKEEEMIRMEEERRIEEKIRLEEKERREEEEEARKEEERWKELERRRVEEEERRRVEEEERRRVEEEERRRVEEEERRRVEEEERKEEARRKELEIKRMEEEEQARREEEKRKEMERMEEEERRREEVKARKEEERREEEEKRIAEEEMRKGRMEADKRKQEEEKRIEEEIFKKGMFERQEQEKRRQQSDNEEEGKARSDEEEYVRMIKEMKKRDEEREKTIIEESKRKKEGNQRIWKEEEERAGKEREENERSLVVNKEEVEKKTRNFSSEEPTKNVTQIKSTVVASLNPFDENFGSPMTGSQPAVPLLTTRAPSSGDKDHGGSQWEKRPAPQPPGTHQGPPAQAGRRSTDTGTALPLRSFQAVSPVARSEPRNTSMHASTVAVTLTEAKRGKGPAPSRPCSGAKISPTSNISQTRSSDVKQEPVSYGLNPFEDDEDEDEAGSGSAGWPPAAASSARIKSSKKAHAPPLPELNPDPASIVPDNHGAHPRDPCSISEAKPVTPQGSGGKREEPPTTKRRLLPVKPLNPLRQMDNQGEKDIKTFGIMSDDQRNAKVDPELKGPYSQLTRAELVSLVLKQDGQLLEKDKKVSELEEYIDNLLVRVMEEQPTILMSLNTLKKPV